MWRAIYLALPKIFAVGRFLVLRKNLVLQNKGYFGEELYLLITNFNARVYHHTKNKEIIKSHIWRPMKTLKS